MYFVYSLLLTLGFLILLPRFLLDALRHGKYVAGFGERLGSLPSRQTRTGVVWLHCVSVGESQAARPLIAGLRKRFPDLTIVVSTTTLTGQRLARELFKNEATRIFYFPFDWTWTVRRTLNTINPAAVLIMETEIWPNFMRECGSRKVRVAIVNGRLSHQSFRRYKWIRGFLRRVLTDLQLAVMQTEKDADRIRALGLAPDRVFVAGNLKFDAGSMTVASSVADEFRVRFQFNDKTPLIVAASTHAPEERLILEAFQQARAASNKKPRLLLAPRHPERFAEVAALLDRSELSWTRRTSGPSPNDATCDVILLDTIGELARIYSLAYVVFVGGSIANSGGHNILEPAALGTAIVTGAHTHNFEAIVKAFVTKDAIIQLTSESATNAERELADLLVKLLADESRARELGRRAKQLVEQNVGATDRTLDLLETFLLSSPRDGVPAAAKQNA